MRDGIIVRPMENGWQWSRRFNRGGALPISLDPYFPRLRDGWFDPSLQRPLSLFVTRLLYLSLASNVPSRFNRDARSDYTVPTQDRLLVPA